MGLKKRFRESINSESGAFLTGALLTLAVVTAFIAIMPLPREVKAAVLVWELAP